MTSPNGQRPPRGLSSLWHGPYKAGKSTLGDTGPKPRLLMDAEGGLEWTPSRKIDWDPMRQSPPVPDRRVTAGYGQPSITPAWESALVHVRDHTIFHKTYEVLYGGRHPFNSATVDSTSEAQQQIIFGLVGYRQMEQASWGVLARQVTGITRQWKDLTQNPVKRIWSVAFICGSRWDDKLRKIAPLLQGTQTQDFMPYYPDVIGYVYHGGPGDPRRYAKIEYDPGIVTGERVGGRLPGVMPLAYAPAGIQGWTLETMAQQVIAGG